MDWLWQEIVEFFRVRQINFAIAGLLTVLYMAIQHFPGWDRLFGKESLEYMDGDAQHRSSSCLREKHHREYSKPERHTRHRRGYGRCKDCDKCNAVKD